MEENNWKIGDVVQLKSGGPKMTISSEKDERDGTVHCEWFDESGQLKAGRFKAQVLAPSAG